MTPWWRGASVYQVYVRSFCDGNGDGQGDFAGLTSKLDYIKALGVDAIWLSPIHPSPNRDWGYDVADYEGVHPDYGTLDDFAALVEAAHARGLKIILDEVLAQTSMPGSRRHAMAMPANATGMSGPIRKPTARCPTTGSACSAARPGPTSRPGAIITTTNSCASSPS